MDRLRIPWGELLSHCFPARRRPWAVPGPAGGSLVNACRLLPVHFLFSFPLWSWVQGSSCLGAGLSGAVSGCSASFTVFRVCVRSRCGHRGLRPAAVSLPPSSCPQGPSWGMRWAGPPSARGSCQVLTSESREDAGTESSTGLAVHQLLLGALTWSVSQAACSCLSL